MESTITEIAPDVFRLSTFEAGIGLQFNQFLVKDDEPFLWHTGYRKMFPATLAAASTVIDPSTLRWIGFSHFESDECGALNRWLAAAPRAQAVCTFVGTVVSVDDFAERPSRALADGEVLETGRHRFRFLATPHVPHGWDAGLVFDETTQTLFSSDLFFHPGDPEPMAGAEIVGRAREAIVQGSAGPLANDMPYTSYTDRTLRRLAELEPTTIAVMHGSSFRGDGRQAVLDLAAVIRDTIGAPGR
jgi:flavorubredoxin